MYKEILILILQLSNKYITDLENQIKTLTEQQKITKEINIDGNEIYNDCRTQSLLLFNSDSPIYIREFMKEMKAYIQKIDSNIKIQYLMPLCSMPKGKK